MITDSAPFVLHTATSQSTPTLDNIDYTKIDEFNRRIGICSSCSNVVAKENPSCRILDKPLSIISEINQCPEGKW